MTDLITRPEESYRAWRVVVCDQGTSNEEANASYRAVENTTTLGCNARKINKQNIALGDVEQAITRYP